MWILYVVFHWPREVSIINKYDNHLLVYISFIFGRTLQREENKEEREKKIKRYGVSEEFSKDNSFKKSQQNLITTKLSKI